MVVLALAAYGNSLANGFAYDDVPVIRDNPVVVEGRGAEAWTRPYWPDASEGRGLYRPFTVWSFQGEWALFGGDPTGFHAVNVAVHAAVSLLVFLLVLQLSAGPVAAGVAGGLFAVHPVHTEAVANVVGRGELYAAFFYLLGCLLYLRGRGGGGVVRALRLLGVGACYALALGSKEIGVTLPGALLLLEAFRADGARALARRLRGEAPVYALLACVFGAYLLARSAVLGEVRGEYSTAFLHGMPPSTRALTSVALWSEYARLLLAPFDLSADYGPAVFGAARGVGPRVIAGAACLLALGVGAFLAWGRERLVALGIVWAGVAVLPVSQLLIPIGTLLAERTLYLPSVGVALVGAGGTRWVLARELRTRRVAGAAALGIAVAFFARTVTRNPEWLDSPTAMSTLASEHPESYRALWIRAVGLTSRGYHDEAERYWEAAVALAPRSYRVLVEGGAGLAEGGREARAAELLGRAVELYPERPDAYRELAALQLRRGRAGEAHRVAALGLGRVGFDTALWARLSESYVALDDLEAAVRARRAALAADPGSREDWIRLAEILDLMDRPAAADEARRRAASPPREGGP